MSYNWGQGLSGAATGAGIGGFFGAPGAAVGGGLGLLAGFGGGGGGDQFKKHSVLNQGQEGLLQNILQQLGSGGQLGQGYGQALSGLQDFMDPSSEAMSRFADPYMRQFNQETVPGLAERFAGGGAMGGGLSSSGFGQALSSAGGNLQSQLASMKTGLQRQAIGDIMNQYKGMAQQGLGTQAFRYQAPGMGGMSQLMATLMQSGIPLEGFQRLFSQGGGGGAGGTPQAGFPRTSGTTAATMRFRGG